MYTINYSHCINEGATSRRMDSGVSVVNQVSEKNVTSKF